MNVRFGGQCNGTRSRSMFFSFPAILYDPVFVTCQYCYRNEALLLRESNDKQMFNRWNFFSSEEHEEHICCLTTSSQRYADAFEWFHHILQACVIALGRFDEDSVGFPYIAVFYLGRLSINTRLIFDSLVYKRKLAQTTFERSIH